VRSRFALTGLVAAVLWAAACASSGSLEDATEEFARALRARGVDPSQVTIPHAVTPAMEEWARKQIPRATPEDEKLDRLLTALVDPGRLGLTYEPGITHTAEEAFSQRKANCLAFTSLFVGLARSLGVPAFYVDIDDVERFEKEGDLMVVSGHVSAGFNAAGQLKILDFTPEADPGYRQVRPMSDETAIGLYHSNRGAELLRAGREGEAMGWLKKAVAIDPDLPGAWVNLGVALRRNGDVSGAEAAYRSALEADPGTAAAYHNLAALLRLRGQDAEAQELLALAAKLDRRNPYSYLALGDLSLAHGRAEEARRFYRRALRLDRDEPEVYAALGEAALAAGKHSEARRWLKKAVGLAQDNDRVKRLEGRLSRL
jgi:tetratricopeptide (TPR) repeat protein